GKGGVSVTGNAVDLPKFPTDLPPISALVGIQRKLFALDRDGKLHFVETPDRKPAMIPENKTEGIRAITGNSKDMSVIYRDGRWELYVAEHPKFRTMIWGRRFQRLFHKNVAVDEYGDLEYRLDERFPVPEIDLAVDEIEHMRVLLFGACLRKKNGTWELWLNQDGQQRPLEEPIIEALHGAVDLEFFPSRKDPTHIFALMPADIVSRSGFWTANELISHRQQLQNQN
ncbi:MAG: hypothetical protein AAF585_26585, partial [Verrucomicrobiota bacterium]